MAEQVRQVALDADPVSLGAIVAIMGEVYLVILAILIIAMAAGLVPAERSFLRIEDPAIAANFTA
ncbi:MAG: hypothetical protein C0484_22435 [Rhodospirillum sp.]|nr:hypothetical protein [Rhodospirillum sp.]